MRIDDDTPAAATPAARAWAMPTFRAVGDALVRVVRRGNDVALRFTITYPWILALMAVSVAFFAICLAMSHQLGVPIRDPEGSLFGKRIVLPIMLMVGFFWIDLYYRARKLWNTGEVGLLRAARTVFLERWWPQRLLLVVPGFMCYHITYLAYRNMKSWVPLHSWKTWDPELLRFDRALMFGHDPATVLHHALGTNVAAYVLSTVYLLFIPLVPIGIGAAMMFTERLRDAYLYIAASVYAWMLGTFSYFLIPSLGPFAAKPSLFDDLPRTGVTLLQENLMEHRLQLYADPLGSGDIQSVAAFASLHVGVVYLTYLVCRELGWRRLQRTCLIALVPTALSTVYFGWHFLPDLVAGALIAHVSLGLARWTIHPRRVPVVGHRVGHRRDRLAARMGIRVTADGADGGIRGGWTPRPGVAGTTNQPSRTD